MADNPQKIAQMMALAMLLGSVPFGYLVLRLKSPGIARDFGRDTIDPKLLGGDISFAAVALLCAAKGFVPVYLAKASLASPWLVLLAAGIALVSALFPYWLMFKPSSAAAAAFPGIFFALFPNFFGGAVALALLILLRRIGRGLAK